MELATARPRNYNCCVARRLHLKHDKREQYPKDISFCIHALYVCMYVCMYVCVYIYIYGLWGCWHIVVKLYQASSSVSVCF